MHFIETSTFIEKALLKTIINSFMGCKQIKTRTAGLLSTRWLHGCVNITPGYLEHSTPDTAHIPVGNFKQNHEKSSYEYYILINLIKLNW